MKFAATILAVYCAAQAANGAYPQLDVSFRAEGQMLLEVGATLANQIKIKFEENYERAQNRLALELEENKVKHRVLDYLDKRQAFRYDNNRKCEAIQSRDDRLKTYLQAVKTASGHLVFPVRQLLTLEEKFLTNVTSEVASFLATPNADKWTFFIDETKAKVKVEAFWSAVSTGKVVPLGFRITRSVLDSLGKNWDVLEQTVEIHKFKHGEFDFRAFTPRRGVFCEGRVQDRLSELRDFVKSKVQKIHDKVKTLVQTFKDLGAVDTWYDQESHLYRINYAPVRQRYTKGIQRIVSHLQEVVYEFGEARKCAVKKVMQNPFDLQDVEDIKEFLAVGRVDYVQIGEVIEGEIPCDLYQGQRKDWPNSAAAVTTVWEWCVANKVQSADYKFQINGAPLVSLNVYITESPFEAKDLKEEILKTYYYKGLRLAYNFYTVRNRTHEYLENLSGDIKDCFQEANQKRLHFRAKIHDAVTKALIARNTKTVEHLSAWRDAVCQAAKVQAGSLRVADLQLHLDDKDGDLEVSFTLLGRHPDIPDKVEEIPLDDAVANVQTTIDEGKVAVNVKIPTEQGKGTPQQQAVHLKAEPGTLRATRQVIVNPDADATTTTHSGLGAGSVAAVAVAMLALGVAVGTVAIFLRKRNNTDYQKL